MSSTMQLPGVVGAGAAVATSASGALDDDGFGRELDRLQQELLEEFDSVEDDTVSTLGTADVVGVVASSLDVGIVAEETICPDSPRRRADTAVAQADAAKARAEKKKLWDAVEAVMSDQKALAELRYRDALGTARAEAEFEKQRVADAWDMIRDICDMNAFAAITRQVHCRNGERALSVGVARRLFEGPATMTSEPKTPASIARDVRPQTPTTDPRIASSQSRRMRLRRDASRDSAALPMAPDVPVHQVLLPLTGASTGYPNAGKPPRSSSRTSIAMPPRPPQQQNNSTNAFDLERSAKMSVPAQPTWKFTKQGDATPTEKRTEENKENSCVIAFDSPGPTGAHGKASGLRQESPSVRDRVLALQGSPPATC